jgi:hypothetical protein
MNSASHSSGYRQDEQASAASNITDTVVDTMVRWPMRLTGATMDLMLQGVQRMTGTSDRDGWSSSRSSSSDTARTSSSTAKGGSHSGPWTSLFTTSNEAVIDQDLSGDDLKYVIWSIIFTKPGHEAILQKQQEELVSYSADANSYAGLKIARLLESARHGHTERPDSWTDRGYASDLSRTKPATTVTSAGGSSVTPSGSSRQERKAGDHESGWRIPVEDQKYIVFLYRVDRRLPRQDDVTHVDRVTVERSTRVD